MYIFAVILYSFLNSACYNIISSKERKDVNKNMDVLLFGATVKIVSITGTSFIWTGVQKMKIDNVNSGSFVLFTETGNSGIYNFDIIEKIEITY